MTAKILCFSVAATVLSFQIVSAAPSSQVVCQKMIDDGRNGPMDFADCQCSYRVADVVLDDDVKALLFDSWLNGTDNMAALEQLPNPRRIKKQFRTFERSLKKNCNLSR